MIGRLALLGINLSLSLIVSGHWMQHYRYNKQGAVRNRRQLEGGSPAQIDLNITVPFIFSARLYPYGEAKGDKVLEPNVNVQAYVLKNEITFLEENYTVIYISKDGIVGFGPGLDTAKKEPFPKGPKALAVYWTPVSLGDTGRVYIRETEDENILQLAASEVQIQYRYGQDFKPKSVFIVTWENTAPPQASKDLPNSLRNLYQVAFINSKNGTFAHTIYSKLKWHDNAIAGFNHGDRRNYITLPGSGSSGVLGLANNSDIGIPGEWLFKVDGKYIYLCGPGFKGVECVNRCDKGEFFYDCSRRCHCANNETCNTVNGACPQPQCSKGWDNPPTCETDIDECVNGQGKNLCTKNQPDCINTPGAYICTCLTGYDNSTQICHGSLFSANPLLPVINNKKPVDGNLANNGLNQNSPVVIVPNLISPTNRLPAAVVPLQPQQQVEIHGGQIAPNQGSPVNANNTVEIHPQAPVLVQTSRTANVNLVPHGMNDNSSSSGSSNNSQQPQFVSLVPVSLVPQTLHPFISPANSTPSATSHVVIVNTTPNVLLCSAPCAQNAHCEVVQNQQKCVCNVGFTGDGNFCVDINECFLENPCEGNARCQNTLGGFNCICEEGYQSNGKQCVDVDECAEGLIQCPSANTSNCINTHGSFECRCKTGYNGNPGSTLGCIDINECLIPEFYCGGFADCENTLGGFRCHCHQGYQRNSDGTGCEDTDECKESPCSKAATCRNAPGSFSCSCLEGYAGDGFDCEETLLYPFSRNSAIEHKLPQQINGIVEIPLVKPMKVFSREISRIYVSANGIVTFDRPLESYIDQAINEIRYVGVAPLYQKIDLTKRGGVFVKETSEYSFLTRANLNVQEDFHDPGFRANSIVVITYDDVVELNQTELEKSNTFQMILAGSDQATYVTLIYDKVNNEKAQVAILSVDPNGGLVLPYSSVNASTLLESSNVRIKGKWMYKIDDKSVLQCPYGLLDPPFCSIDIDECTNGQSRCHPKAACINSFGSYQCVCQPGWTGDGFNCFELTMCFVATGSVCGLNAGCFVPSNGLTPVCMCNAGYFGDGQTCLPDVGSSTENGRHESFNSFNTTISVNTIDVANNNVAFATNLPTTNNVVVNVTQLPTTYYPILIQSINNGSTIPQQEQQQQHTLGPVLHAPPVNNFPPPQTDDNTIDEQLSTPFAHLHKTDRPPTFGQGSRDPTNSIPRQNEVDTAASSRFDADRFNRRSGLESSPTNMLVIIIPAVLCGVWLLLIIVLLVVCVRKRKQKQRDKYGHGYYLPSTESSNKGSTINSSYAAAYGSQWNAPRSTYDYYHGVYYPDPYNPYKY